MKDFNEMTPIELNVLINKINENHELLKSEVKSLTYDIEDIEKKINKKINSISDLEEKYVELMGILMSKQN